MLYGPWRSTITDSTCAHVLYGPFEPGNHEIYDLNGAVIYGEKAGDAMGCVRVAGNVSGLGRDQLLYGSGKHNTVEDGRTDYGAVYLSQDIPEGHLVLPEGMVKFAAEHQSFMGSCWQQGASRRQPFKGAGDINADGLDDILLSARVPGDEPDTMDQVHLLWGVQQ